MLLRKCHLGAVTNPQYQVKQKKKIASPVVLVSVSHISKLWTVYITNFEVPYISQNIMSTRALRRLRGKQRGQEALDPAGLSLGDSSEEQAEEDQVVTANVVAPSHRRGTRQKEKKNKAQKNFSNLYELVR